MAGVYLISAQPSETKFAQRYYPMRGFGNIEAAARFCIAHDELRDYFRSRRTLGETVTRAEQRQLFRDRWVALMRLIAA